MKYALQLRTLYLLYKMLLLLELKSEKVIIFSLPDYDKIFVYQRTTFKLNTSLTGFSRWNESMIWKCGQGSR